MHVPMFTTVAVMTLAVGIGANAAVFSVIEGVLLKPLVYPRPDELVSVDHTAPGVNIKRAGFAPFLYFTYRGESRTLQDVGIWRTNTVSVTGRAEPEQVDSLDVSVSLLPLLGAQPALGRGFTQQDDSPGSPETVILTSGYWRSRFGADPSAVGQRLLLDGRAREIIGVLRDDFRFLDRKPALVRPLQLDRDKTFLGNFSYAGIARLKPGATMALAEADATRMISTALDRFPAFPGFTAQTFREAGLAPSFRTLKESVTGDVATVLWVIMGTIGIVLLIACANVANLLLVRAEVRQQELAIRAALGASWDQIARELFAESVTLGLVGGIVGLAMAAGAVKFLKAVAPANLPRVDQISIDGSVLLFSLGISIAAGLLFGVIPVIKYVGPHLVGSLRSGGRSMSDSKERHRARNTLVVVQVALALVLLVGSGLMIRTFQRLKQVQPGFTRPAELQTLRISIPRSLVSDAVQVVRTEQAIADRIAALPGVTSVGFASTIPLTSGWQDPIFTEDRISSPSQIPPVRHFKFVSPGVLQTAGNSLVAGRDFTWTDVYDKRNVAMISDNLARELWHEPAAALGKRVQERPGAPWREIVGVVSDEYDDGLNQPAPAIVFWPVMMSNFNDETPFVQSSVGYLIRSSRTGSSGFITEVGQAVWSINPNLPLANVRSLQEVYDRSLERTSFALVLLAIAGAMALLLGVAGVYGVISYSVSRRTREIGIRIALGARHAEVTRMFLGHALRLAVIGVASGLVAAVALMQMLSSLLFKVRPFDPFTYAAVSLGLAAAALLASYVPALRATSVDPVEALRAE